MAQKTLVEQLRGATKLAVEATKSVTDVVEAMHLRKGHDHGLALETLGFTPIYVRYNSGLHVSENGRLVSALVEQLVKAWPRPINLPTSSPPGASIAELSLLCHSMGGLVARSACLAAEREGATWRPRLTRLITLGTPHHGAPLERGGNWFEVLLGVSRYSAPLASLGQLRSAGVTDLRYGNVLDEHWQGRDRFAKEEDPRTQLSLPAGVECFAMAGSSSAAATASPSGDGLVPVASALGQHDDPARRLDFPADHQHVAWGASHLDLLGEAVFPQLRDWFEA